MDIGADELNDCNENGIADAEDIANETTPDCNGNNVPDGCDMDPTDPDGNGQVSADCNQNSVPDECDITDLTSQDCNGNGTPDECEPDCQSNGVPDDCDIASGTSDDVNGNQVPDECELGACCLTLDTCQVLLPSECAAVGITHFGPETDCDVVDCASIPAVSEWGLVVLGLLTITAGTLVFGSRRFQNNCWRGGRGTAQ